MKNNIFVMILVCFLALSPITCIISMDQRLIRHKSKRVNYFNTLPRETMQYIFSYCKEPIVDKKLYCIFSCFQRPADNERKALWTTVKNIITITYTCKNFLSAMSITPAKIMLKSYSNAIKNEFLYYVIWNKEEKEVFENMNHYFYGSKRFFIASLLDSEAEFEKDSHNKIINYALHKNDIDLIAFLYKIKKINIENLNDQNVPLIFEIRTAKMALLCENNKSNLYQDGPESCPNILWKAVKTHDISSHVLQFYLEKDIAIFPRQSDGNSLLHELVIAGIKGVKNSDDFIHKAKLLLEKEPELLNDCNYTGETPLDCAKNMLTYTNYLLKKTKPIEQLIKFFEAYDGFPQFCI